MALQEEIEHQMSFQRQPTNDDFPKETLAQDEDDHEENYEGETNVSSIGAIWEELEVELKDLLKKLVTKHDHKKNNVEKLLQEKPLHSEDENVISNWLDKLKKNFQEDEEEEEQQEDCIRERGVSDDQEVVAKLERFKVKALNGGIGTTDNGNKK